MADEQKLGLTLPRKASVPISTRVPLKPKVKPLSLSSMQNEAKDSGHESHRLFKLSVLQQFAAERSLSTERAEKPRKDDYPQGLWLYRSLSSGPLPPAGVAKELSNAKTRPYHPPVLPKLQRKETTRMKSTDYLGPSGKQSFASVVSFHDHKPLFDYKSRQLIVVPLGKGKLKRLIPAPQFNPSACYISVLGTRPSKKSL